MISVFSHSIQSYQQEETANSLDELILHVTTAFDNYPAYKLEKAWVSYQHCMIKTMEERGSNKYKLPHMNKDALNRQGLLRHTLHVPLALVNKIKEIVHNEHNASGNSSEEEM